MSSCEIAMMFIPTQSQTRDQMDFLMIIPRKIVPKMHSNLHVEAKTVIITIACEAKWSKEAFLE